MASNISIVFVAGAWHTDFHVQPCKPFLEKHGYRVVAVELETSKGRRATIEDNLGSIMKAITTELEAGRQVCIIAHSVAGFSVPLAVNRVLESATPEQKSRVIHVAFIATFMARPMETLDGTTWYHIDMETMATTLTVPAEDVFYNGLPAAEAKPFVDALGSNWSNFPPEDLRDNWESVKKQVPGLHYFLCLQDKAVIPERQRLEAQEMGIAVVELDTDHCPMVSRPEVFAEAVHKVLV